MEVAPRATVGHGCVCGESTCWCVTFVIFVRHMLFFLPGKNHKEFQKSEQKHIDQILIMRARISPDEKVLDFVCIFPILRN